MTSLAHKEAFLNSLIHNSLARLDSLLASLEEAKTESGKYKDTALYGANIRAIFDRHIAFLNRRIREERETIVSCNLQIEVIHAKQAANKRLMAEYGY